MAHIAFALMIVVIPTAFIVFALLALGFNELRSRPKEKIPPAPEPPARQRKRSVAKKPAEPAAPDKAAGKSRKRNRRRRRSRTPDAE